MESKITLSEFQGLELKKVRALVGNEQVDLILAQGPDVIRASLDAFMQLSPLWLGKYTTIWHRLCLLGMSRFWWRSNVLPPCLDCRDIWGGKGKSPPVDQRDGNGHELLYAPVEATASWASHLKIGGRSREWALTCITSVYEDFPPPPGFAKTANIPGGCSA